MPSAALFVLLGAAALSQRYPGCIAAITTSATGPVFSGETVAFTDGSIVNPLTHVLSRTWALGDGTTVTSRESNDISVTHTYVNATGRVETLAVRLTERTGLGDCTAMLRIVVSPNGR